MKYLTVIAPLPMRELYIEERGAEATNTNSNTYFNITVNLKTLSINYTHLRNCVLIIMPYHNARRAT